MDHAADDRPNGAICFHATEDAVEARGRDGFIAVAMRLDLVTMRMRMDVVAMPMDVIVRGVVEWHGGVEAEGVHGRAQIQCTQQDEHECDAKLEAQAEPFWNHETEKDDCSADCEKSEAVSETPINSG